MMLDKFALEEILFFKYQHLKKNRLTRGVLQRPPQMFLKFSGLQDNMERY